MKYSAKNPPLVCMMTNSTCYKGTRKMKPVGVLWHSTGANNPYLKRYVQPDKNASNRQELLDMIGINNYNSWNQISVQAGLNCWIGKLADGTVTTLQAMPWDFRPWGCGSGSKGTCNDGWIQFEICEDSRTNKDYFDTVYQEACEITAYLCEMYGLDPRGTVSYNGLQVPVIMSHAESYKWGLGSGHGDPEHWLRVYGKSLDTIREDVAKLMGLSDKPKEEPLQANEYKRGVATQLSTNFKVNEFDCDGKNCCSKTIVEPELVNYLQKIRSHFGRSTIVSSGYRCEKHNSDIGGAKDSYHIKGQAADIYINGVEPLEIAKYAESIGVKGIGLYETKADGNFVHIDTRKTKSFWYGKAEEPRESFVNSTVTPSVPEAPVVPKDFKVGDLVSVANDAVYYNGKSVSLLVKQRKWYISSISGNRVVINKDKEGKYAINSAIHKKYLTLVEDEAPVVSAPVESPKNEVPYLIRVTATLLNYRKGPGMGHAVAGTIKNGGVYTIIEEADGWGRLKSGAGWINLKFVEKV